MINHRLFGKMPNMLLLFLFQAAASEPPPSPGSLQPLFSAEDYPREAIRNRWEGSVSVDVVVGKDGNPKSCSIAKSSGYEVLDNATCNAFLKRAKFAPDRDTNGNPIESIYHANPVNWRLPKD